MTVDTLHDVNTGAIFELIGRAVRVAPNVVGVPALSRLVARHTVPTSDQIWKSVTGCTAFVAQAAGALTAGTGVIYTQGVVFAWSPVHDDHVGLGALLTAALANFGTAPVEPLTDTPNTDALWTPQDCIEIRSDGTTLIKSIGAIIVGATPGTNTVAIALRTIS